MENDCLTLRIQLMHPVPFLPGKTGLPATYRLQKPFPNATPGSAAHGQPCLLQSQWLLIEQQRILSTAA